MLLITRRDKQYSDKTEKLTISDTLKRIAVDFDEKPTPTNQRNTLIALIDGYFIQNSEVSYHIHEALDYFSPKDK